MRKLLLFVMCISLPACTHYLYQGDFSTDDNNGSPCDYRIYWTKTDPIVGEVTAGPGILQSTCSTSKTFSDSAQGVVLELTTDQYQTEPPATGTSVICARILNMSRFQDYDEGDLHIKFLCNTIDDDFAVVKRSLPAPVNDAYVVPIGEPASEWAFGKDNAMAPAPLEKP